MPAPKIDNAEDVSRKLTELEESISKVKGGYAELGQYMETLKDISSRYFRLMDLYAKHGKISVDLAAPDIKDQISKDIIRILLDRSDKDKEGSNLSEITRELKNVRGSASRRIVRDKVGKLEKMGHVKKVVSGKIPTYTISDSLVEKWYSLLGMPKS
jgi:hypothetical protein